MKKTYRTLGNKRMIGFLALCIMTLFLTACAAPSGTAQIEDYTGKLPNGSLGTVKYSMDRPGYLGLKVTVTLKYFGKVGVADEKDVQAVSKELVKYAKLYDETSEYSETQYYYEYFKKDFQAGNTCKLTFYYLVPPETAYNTLHFVFDYTTDKEKQLLINVPCELFPAPEK